MRQALAGFSIAALLAVVASGQAASTAQPLPGLDAKVTKVERAATASLRDCPPGTNTVTVFTYNSSFFVGVNPANGNASANDGDGSYFWLIHYVDNSRTSPNDRCETSSISHNDG